jgi:hypothetical protein
LTLVSGSNTFPCQWETLADKTLGRSKNPLDRDHGIYRDPGSKDDGYSVLKAYPSASGPTKYGDKRRFGW